MHGTFSVSHQIEPAILYFGTPVVLIGSSNEDSSFNLAPMSSAWWVGWRCMLGLTAIEVRVTRVHAHAGLMMKGAPNRIDPDKWRPLIMSFQQFYGLTPDKLQRSELGQIPEAMYKPPGWRPAA
jgi:flavin reductase (DIM6/NTAB) family NADH-FMN oxidoreductase RutF